MSQKDMGGHSGCQVILIEDNERIFVRKISKDTTYNERLKKQCDKQRNFKNQYLKCPRILEEGYTQEGLFFFDMDYIQGETLAEYLQKVDMSKLKDIVENVTAQFYSTESLQDVKVQQIFNDKIEQLKNDEKIKGSISAVEALNKLSNHTWEQFHQSNCHGDFTLENILVKNDELYLIDFLDSFYDSWLIDAGKLLQDVQTLWSYRHQKEMNPNLIVRLITFRDLLIQKVAGFDKNFVTEMYYALLLHLIRIYPYTKSEETFSFLDRKVDSILRKISDMEEGK